MRSRRGNSARKEAEGQQNVAFVGDQMVAAEGSGELANALLSIESTMKHHLETLAARKAELVEAAKAAKTSAAAAAAAVPVPVPAETPQLRQRSAKSARATRRISVIGNDTVPKEPPAKPRRIDKVGIVI